MRKESPIRSADSPLTGIVRILALVMMLSPGLASAGEEPADSAELNRQLQALEAEIDKFREMLDRTRTEKDSLEGDLEKSEKSINEMLKKIRSLETSLEKGEDRLGRLVTRQQELQLAREEQRKYLVRQIRAAYEAGNQEFLKILLNQEDTNRLSRMLTYYEYFSRARAAQVRRYSETIDQLQVLSMRIARENSALLENRNQLQAERSQLLKARTEKRRVLAALNRDIRTSGRELEIRLANRERLESLIERIRFGSSRLPTPADVVPFETLKGELILPVAGRITHRYGNKRSSGKLRWNGVVIEAPEGEPVFAIHYGRVVFSDWLRGFGLLMIINHGEGYMSLYGHNQVLYRETGDWVTAGETIATVGNSGGQNQSGLYFEIRVAGKTADPQLWCRLRPGRSA